MKALSLLFGCVVATSALAESPVLTLQAGAHEDIRSAGVGLRLPPMWADRWGGWHASAHLEFGLNHLHADEGDGASSADAVGAGASLRVARGEQGFRPYAEVGLGGNLFSHTRFGPKELSTAFQFGEHLGLGAELTNGWSVGWRFQHYSNADIKKPNDGIDLHEVVIGVKF